MSTIAQQFGMEEALAKAKEFKPKKFRSETDHMIKLIEDFIDNN